MTEMDCFCAWGDSLVEMVILIYKLNMISIKTVLKTQSPRITKSDLRKVRLIILNVKINYKNNGNEDSICWENRLYQQVGAESRELYL